MNYALMSLHAHSFMAPLHHQNDTPVIKTHILQTTEKKHPFWFQSQHLAVIVHPLSL